LTKKGERTNIEPTGVFDEFLFSYESLLSNSKIGHLRTGQNEEPIL
jgi:hypothetical protein